MIEIVEYDVAWPERFAAEAARIRDGLGAVARAVEHVGSTAVPGLAAKNVIDIQLSVASFAPEDAYRKPLEALGYCHRSDDEPAHRLFHLDRADGRRLVHLHVCEAGSDWESRHLAFRDHLRRDPAARDAYAQLKRELAPRFSNDHVGRNQYADAKGPFIEAQLVRARGRH